MVKKIVEYEIDPNGDCSNCMVFRTLDMFKVGYICACFKQSIRVTPIGRLPFITYEYDNCQSCKDFLAVEASNNEKSC